MVAPDPEYSTSTQTLQPSVEVTFGTINQLHDKFQAFVAPLARNCASQWRLYVTAGGVRTRVATGIISDVAPTDPLAPQLIQWTGDGYYQADGGTVFELVGVGTSQSSTAQCRATLAGFDYSVAIPETISNGTAVLPANGNEVVLATLNNQFQFLDCYADVTLIKGATRFKLYATADALAVPPGPRVLVRVFDVDPSTPPGQTFTTIPLFQGTTLDGNSITSIGANKYELVAQNLSGVGAPSVTGVLSGRYSQGSGGAGSEFVSNFVWRPGAVSQGNVFATWPEVVAAVAQTNGAVTIGLDTDTAPAVIPPAALYDLRPAGISGPVTMVNASKNPPFNTPFAQIGPGAVTIKGLTGLNDVQLDNQSTVSVMPITLPGAFYMQQNAKIFQTGVGHFWDVTGGTYTLIMDDFSGVTDLGGGTALRAVAPATVFLSLNDASVFDANMVTALAGALFIGMNEQARYGTQAAAVIAPVVRRQSGTAAIVVGTGKSAAIPVTLTAASRIIVTGKTLVTDANTKGYAALSADRVNGAPGSFKITALLDGGAGGAVNGADASTEIDWEVINGP